MNQKVQLYGLVGALLVGVIILGIFAKQGVIKFPTNEKIDQASSKKVLPMTQLPIPAGHSNVVNVTSFYTLVGIVGSISPEDISLETNGSKLPIFPLTKNTKYFLANKQGVSNKLAFEDIKTGANVILTLSYNQEKSTWETLRVTLNPLSQPASASPSASRK